MKRLAIILTLMLIPIACGGGGHRVAYRPIAFGENNQCYYVNNPAEAQMLMDQGLCDRGWVPTIMPGYWHQRYYPYYASPAYYNTYVPVPVRTVYVQSERSWGSTNKSAIATATKEATYQGSNGKTVPASKIGATKYGAGNRFGKPGTKFGGGSRDATTPGPGSPGSGVKSSPAPAETPAVKSTPAPKAPSAPKSTPSKPSGGSKSSGGTKSGGGYKSGGGGSKSYGGGSRSGGGYSGGGRSFGGGRR